MESNFKKDMWKIPNLLSLFRIILIPFFLYAFNVLDNVALTIVIVFLSCASDAVDGFIARRYHQITELGILLDPLADKLTQIAMLLALSLKEIVPWFIFAALLLKEVLMVVGAFVLRNVKKKGVIPSNKWGKSATVCFYAGVVLLLFKCSVGIYIMYLTLALAVIAFCSYLQLALSLLKTDQKD